MRRLESGSGSEEIVLTEDVFSALLSMEGGGAYRYEYDEGAQELRGYRLSSSLHWYCAETWRVSE